MGWRGTQVTVILALVIPDMVIPAVAIPAMEDLSEVIKHNKLINSPSIFYRK